MSPDSDLIDLVPLTCPSCGARINAVSGSDKVICDYCGNAFAIVENKKEDGTDSDEHINITLNLPEEEETTIDEPIRIRLNLPDEEGRTTTRTYSKFTKTTRITVNVTDEDDKAFPDDDIENHVKSALRRAEDLRRMAEEMRKNLRK